MFSKIELSIGAKGDISLGSAACESFVLKQRVTVRLRDLVIPPNGSTLKLGNPSCIIQNIGLAGFARLQ